MTTFMEKLHIGIEVIDQMIKLHNMIVTPEVKKIFELLVDELKNICSEHNITYVRIISSFFSYSGIAEQDNSSIIKMLATLKNICAHLKECNGPDGASTVLDEIVNLIKQIEICLEMSKHQPKHPDHTCSTGVTPRGLILPKSLKNLGSVTPRGLILPKSLKELGSVTEMIDESGFEFVILSTK